MYILILIQFDLEESPALAVKIQFDIDSEGLSDAVTFKALREKQQTGLGCRTIDLRKGNTVHHNLLGGWTRSGLFFYRDKWELVLVSLSSFPLLITISSISLASVSSHERTYM